VIFLEALNHAAELTTSRDAEIAALRLQVAGAFEACVEAERYLTVWSQGVIQGKFPSGMDEVLQKLRAVSTAESSQKALERVKLEARQSAFNLVLNFMHDECYTSMSGDPDDCEFDESKLDTYLRERIAVLESERSKLAGKEPSSHE